MSNKRRETLYAGVTNDLEARYLEHRMGLISSSFTKRYNLHRLVCAEFFSSINDAIAAEKRIKAWRGEKKIALIESSNPDWIILGEQWFQPRDSSLRSE